MSEAITIVLNDSTPTPVSFNPERIGGGKQSYIARAVATIAAGAQTLVTSLTSSDSNSSVDKQTLRLNFPLVRTNAITTEDEVRDIARFKGEFILPRSMTSTERADLLAYVQGAYAAASVVDMVEDLENVW